MDSTKLIIAVAFAILVAGTLVYLFLKQRRELKAAQSTKPSSDETGISTRQLQLQAYERLILLTDRIALPNLIQRVS
ncbi:MAG TPA: hypothetical protein VHC48_10935, partial [Puia sp.]|nr:hypothetical protein [Puia sp.]